MKENNKFLKIIDELDIKSKTVPLDVVESASIKEADERLAKLRIDEESKWAQHSKVKHVQQGGNNTKYFHLVANGKCRGFVNRSAIEVGVWRFVEGGEHDRAIRDGGSTSLPSFRSRNGGETLRAAIIHYKATSAWLQ
jgi:hypothetical protein